MNDSINSTETDLREFAPRFKLLYAMVGFAALILFARLWYLQIIEGQELREYSEKNRVKETKIPAPRGFILDRDLQVLVQNLPGFSVTISPQYATTLQKTANEVGRILNLEPEKIISMVANSKSQNGPFKPALIKDNLSRDEVFRLKLIRFKHPGLNIVQNIVRHYPLGENGAQLFGYVAEISKQQIDLYNKKYTGFNFEQGDLIGKSGLEEVWERTIRGTAGLSYIEVDARGREATTDTPSFLGLKGAKATPGYNLVLTIDRDLQIAAHKAMTEQKDPIGPRIGSLVAVKNNGEILAWVNTPSYDPNTFAVGITSEMWSQLVNHPFKPMLNKVIQNHYAPGSTFKPFVALAALQEKEITPATKIFAPASFKFGNRVYHDHSKTGYGNINVVEAIERSSNVFFYKMGIALGIDRISKYAAALGIGSRTGVQMTSEVPGLMPTSEWKKRQYGEDWQPGENLSNAIGQGFVLTTPLQMALAYSAIGTNGKLYKPFLVKRLIDTKNNLIEEFNPQLVRDLSTENDSGVIIEKETFMTVKEGMRRVANGASGTARWYRIPGIEMAGKTGTTQVRSFSADQIYEKCNQRPVEDRHHGWYVAFAPADYPEIAVAVLAEHACAGSSGGAPVVRDVIRAYFEKYHPEMIKDKKVSPTVIAAPPSQESEEE